VASDQWLSEFMRTIALIAVLVTTSLAQVVVEPWQVSCNEERVRPNIDVTVQQHVFGELRDPTGAAFQDSRVILRKQGGKGKFADYRTVISDKKGRFDLGSVEPGKYRFLPAPNRGWKQPKEVTCGGSPHCEIRLTLELNPTDQPFAGCPIR